MKPSPLRQAQGRLQPSPRGRGNKEEGTLEKRLPRRGEETEEGNTRRLQR